MVMVGGGVVVAAGVLEFVVGAAGGGGGAIGAATGVGLVVLFHEVGYASPP
jgi:hypothetical protein